MPHISANGTQKCSLGLPFPFSFLSDAQALAHGHSDLIQKMLWEHSDLTLVGILWFPQPQWVFWTGSTILFSIQRSIVGSVLSLSHKPNAELECKLSSNRNKSRLCVFPQKLIFNVFLVSKQKYASICRKLWKTSNIHTHFSVSTFVFQNKSVLDLIVKALIMESSEVTSLTAILFF